MVTAGNNFIDAGSGTAVVMVPGMEGAKEFFQPQIDRMSGKYHIVACDLAVRKPSISTSIKDYAAEVLKTMDSLGIEKAVVLGESMGGMVVQEIATSHPERVLALVLVNTFDNARTRMGFGPNMFTLATLVHNLVFLPFLNDRMRFRLLMWVGRHRGFVLDPSPGNRDLVQYFFDHKPECGPGGFLDRFLACGRQWYTEKLKDIRVPTLVIRGTEDRLVSPEATVQFVGRIPGARLALVEGGGHCCSFTVPDVTTNAVLDWLSDSGL